jgi:hypothetical protein
MTILRVLDSSLDVQPPRHAIRAYLKEHGYRITIGVNRGVITDDNILFRHFQRPKGTASI